MDLALLARLASWPSNKVKAGIMRIVVEMGVPWKIISDDWGRPISKETTTPGEDGLYIATLKSALKDCMQHVPVYVQERYRELIE